MIEYFKSISAVDTINQVLEYGKLSANLFSAFRIIVFIVMIINYPSYPAPFLIFGLVFLTTVMKVRRENLRKLMMISSIGMTLLFGSIVFHGMMYMVTPPFGLITLSVMGLGSYMLLMGLLISSKEIANDALIRRELYHIAEDQLHLIRNLGQTEMERAMVKKCKPIVDKLVTVEENNQQDLFDEEHYKEMIKEVLNELKSRK